MSRVLRALPLVALIMIAVAGVVQAEDINAGYDDVFYSDSTFTTVVGERYQQCFGGRHGTGVLSDYVITDEWDCSTFSDLGPGCTSWLCTGGQEYPWEIYHGCECVSH
jgi:hypothetical protein